jgi:hypothetical protein
MTFFKPAWAAALAAILIAASASAAFSAPSTFAAPAPDRPRFWQANLADWDAVLLRTEEPFFVSGFRPVIGLGIARLSVSGSLAPTYLSQGGHPGRIRSAESGGDAWFAPNPEWAVGLGGRRQGWSEGHADGTAWSLRASADRETLPISLYYHGERGTPHPRFAALATLTDGERGNWAATVSASGGDAAGDAGGPGGAAVASGRWRVELAAWRDRNQENWSAESPEADSSARRWNAGYRDAAWGTGVYGIREFGFGALAGKLGYSASRPDFGRQEYQLGDSSRAFRAGLAFSPRPVIAGGRWNLRSAYGESQVFTDGMRLPAGATGFKRFHHALGQALTVYSGAEWEGTGGPGPFRFRAGAFHRYYRYRTSPHPEAYYERKETLSYNRLESSLLASLYGGFQQSAELVSADFLLRTFEFRPALSLDLGPFGADVSVPTAYARLDARVSGETVSRKLLAVEIDRQYAWELRGPLIMAAPGIALRYRQGPAALSAHACHALILKNDLHTGEGGASAGSGGGDAYPWEGNGLLLGASASLDF